MNKRKKLVSVGIIIAIVAALILCIYFWVDLLS